MVSILPALRAHRSPVALFLLLCALPACFSWRVGTPTPTQFVERERPDRIRVTRPDGTTLFIDHPAVVGDTLVGPVSGIFRATDTTRMIRLAPAEVRSIGTEHFSAGRTILLIGGAFAGVAVVCGMTGCLHFDPGVTWYASP